MELKNIFSFLYEGFKKNVFKFQQFDNLAYSQWLNLIICSIIILAEEDHVSDHILLNFIQYLKVIGDFF